MGVVSRYVLARFLGTFVATLVILVLLVVIVELLSELNDILEASQGFGDVLRYVGLRIPSYYLPFLVPVATFIAAYVSIGNLARHHEFVALKAGGISPLRALAPVLIAAALLSGLGLVFNETVAISAHQAWLRQARGDDGEVTFRRGSFWYHKGRYVYNIRDADPSARRLDEVVVFELDEVGRPLRLIQARRAEIEGNQWRLEDAVIRTFDPERPAESPGYERIPETVITLAEERALLQAGVSALSIRDLIDYRDQQPRGDPEAERAELLLHQRVTEPLCSLLFALLALPLALRAEQIGSLARPALQGVLVLFLFYTAREYGGTLATQGVLEAAPTTWGVIALFAAYGALRLARAPR